LDDIRYWVGLNLVPQIGSARTALLVDYFQDVEIAWNASAASLRAAGLPQAAIERLLYYRTRLDLDAEMRKLDAVGVKILTWQSPDYPKLLRAIDHPPPVLYVRGEILPADEWAIAVVGTRHASAYGKEATLRLVRGLAESGITVVSGLALGIDGIAHHTALEAGGRTIAVLACGLDIIYPARHADLARRIVTAGALVSDYPLGTRPDASNFPPRNRIISGLSLGTLVVEAGRESGALITLRYALEHGRETFAVPGNVYNHASEGTNAAIQRGEAKLVVTVRDILEELNLTMVVQHREVREIAPENPTEQALVACLSAEPAHIDEIVRASGLATAAVSSALCMLELKGLVRRVDNMSYVLAH
jgi:DNA processing protein